MKGILLAGGSGSRLYPSTKSISKQLLPVYDKPTIYYPLSILMLSGVQEILIISTPRDIPLIRDLLGDGAELGLKFTYEVQHAPKGISEALIIGEQFLAGSPCMLILGDNIFYGNDMQPRLTSAVTSNTGATIFAYHVQNPQAFGVIEFDAQHRAISIEEKPAKPKTNWVATGLYIYDGTASKKARQLKPSNRGELEITDLNRMYLQEGSLNVVTFGRGIAWLDAGTHDALIDSSLFVKTIESRQGVKIACIEEIAYAKKFITKEQFQKLAEDMPNSSYGQYVKNLAAGKMPGI
jgi:glucose-1-phosphate thymidylyltransferase